MNSSNGKRAVVSLLALLMVFSGVGSAGIGNGLGPINAYAMDLSDELFGISGNRSASPMVLTDIEDGMEWKKPKDMPLGFATNVVNIPRRDGMAKGFWSFVFCENPVNVASVNIEGFTASAVIVDGYDLTFVDMWNNASTTHSGKITVTMKDGTKYVKSIPNLTPVVLNQNYWGTNWPRFFTFGTGSVAKADANSEGIELFAFTADSQWDNNEPNKSNFGDAYETRLQDVYVDGKKLVRGVDYTVEITRRKPIMYGEIGEFWGATTWKGDSNMAWESTVYVLRVDIKNAYVKKLPNGYHQAVMQLATGEGYSQTVIVENSTAVEIEDKLPEVTTEHTEYDGNSPADVNLGISLGEGETAATDITEVKIGDTILDAEDYEFDGDGVLTVKESVLYKLDNGEYTVTVTFNNTDRTEDTASLVIKNNNTLPDIIGDESRTFDNESPRNLDYPIETFGSGSNKSDKVVTLKLSDVFEEIEDVETSDTKWIKTMKYGGKDVILVSKAFLSTLEDGNYEVRATFNTQPKEIEGKNVAYLEVINHKENEPDNSGDVIYNITVNIIINVYVDGEKISDTDYDFDIDTGELTIKDEFIETLEPGVYTVEVETEENQPEEEREVLAPIKKPMRAPVASKGPSFTDETKTVDRDNAEDVIFEYGLGTGDKAATDITSVSLNGIEVPFTAEDGTLTITGDYLSNLEPGGYNVTVVFNDGENTTFTESKIIVVGTSYGPTLEADNVEWDGETSEEVTFTYDLGEGEKAATDIVKVIIDGEEVEFIANFGVLSISNEVMEKLSDGEHEAFVSFDDEAKTTYKVIITVSSKDDAGDNGNDVKDSKAPSFDKNNHTIDKSELNDVSYTYDLGEGDKGASEIVSVTIDGEEVDFRTEDGTLVIPSDVLEALETGTHDVEVAFDDEEGTTVSGMTITITDNSGSDEEDEGIAPSFNKKNYTVDKSELDDVSYTYDLGEGNKGASEIVSVTIDGKEVDITAEDGTLIISSDVLADLEEGTHNVEVSFDDEEGTVITGMTITITDKENEKLEGPSVKRATKTYNKKNPSEIEFEYSLGSGDLAATDIVEVIINGDYVDFTAEDGILTIFTDDLDDIENGTYEVIVIFDDEDETEDTHAKIKIIGKTDEEEEGKGNDKPSTGDEGEGDNKPSTGDEGEGNDKPSTGDEGEGNDKPSTETTTTKPSTGSTTSVKPYRPSNGGGSSTSSSNRTSSTHSSSGSDVTHGPGVATTTINDSQTALSGLSNFNLVWYLAEDGNWFVYEKDSAGNLGNTLKGWYNDKSDGKWYYLDTVDGHMWTGWNTIDGKTYYFAETVPQQTYFGDNEHGWVYNVTAGSRPYGSMYSNEITPDGHTVDSNGVQVN